MNLIIKINKLHVLYVCRFAFNINYLFEVLLYMYCLLFIIYCGKYITNRLNVMSKNFVC